MKEITLKPIGIVKNNVKEPRFGNFANEVSEIIFDKIEVDTSVDPKMFNSNNMTKIY